ncbi:hypothetical protein PENTCL1PPCAC_24179, partial [Pristionchus entomophagus]
AWRGTKHCSREQLTHPHAVTQQADSSADVEVERRREETIRIWTTYQDMVRSPDKQKARVAAFEQHLHLVKIGAAAGAPRMCDMQRSLLQHQQQNQAAAAAAAPPSAAPSSGITCEICDVARTDKNSYLLHLQSSHGL